MKPLSMDLKERILAAILNDKETNASNCRSFLRKSQNGAENKVPISGHRHFATPEPKSRAEANTHRKAM
jgi:hypothetical protein